MQIQIGVSSDRTISFAKSCAILRDFGADVTLSSNRSIQVAEEDAITMLVRHLSANIKEMIKIGKFSPLSFDNFLTVSIKDNEKSLEKGTWGRNGQLVFDCVWKYLFARDNSYLRSILCPTTRPADFQDWYKNCQDTTHGILTKHANCLTSPHKGKSHIPRKWAYCLLPLQAAVTDYRILDLLPRLFEMPQPEVDQRASIEAYSSYFTSPKWLQTFMYPIFVATAKMVNSDLAIEDKIIKLLRSKSIALNDKERFTYLRGEGSRPAFNFEGWSEITKFTHGNGKGFKVFDYKLYNLMDSTGKLYDRDENTSELMNRIKALVLAGILTDLIKTLLKYGPNPKLRFDYEPDNEAAKANLVKRYLE